MTARASASGRVKDVSLQPDPRSDSPHEVRPERRLPDWAVGLLAVEGIALGIALALPVTRSKTGGSTWTPAHIFTPDPTYLQEVAASFVVVNALLLGLGLVARLVGRRGGSE